MNKELEELKIENERLKQELAETIGAIDNVRIAKETWQSKAYAYKQALLEAQAFIINKLENI